MMDRFVPAPVASPVPYLQPAAAPLAALPGDITAYRTKLEATHHEVGEFGRLMDGYFFNVVGVDAAISLVPVIGDWFSALTKLWLIGKAGQVRVPMGDRLILFGFGLVEFAFGFLPGVGDVVDIFFRSHAWGSARVQTHIVTQLAHIEEAEARARNSGLMPEDVTHLRDALFRGGKTQQDVWMRLGIIGAVCIALLGYCAHQESERTQRIQACEAAGGWLCSWRN